MRTLILLLSLIALGCSSSAQRDSKIASKGAADDSAAKASEPKKIGSACEPSPADMQAGCPGGSFCAPLAGGLCTAMCGESACPGGSVCVDSARFGQACLAGCESDADCRKSAGYVCDPAWKACVLPGLAAPVAPACEGEVPPRKTFGKVTQISTSAGPGTYHFEPAAALSASGDLTAVYITNSLPDLTKPGHPNVLAASTIGKNGALSGDRPVTSKRENHYDPWMATDRQGTMYLVWMGFDGGRAPERNMEIALSTSKDGITWTEPRMVHDVATDCPDSAPGCLDKPMIAIGPDKQDRKRDAIYVFYYSEPGGGLKAVRSVDKGETFGKSALVGDSAYGDAEVSEDGDVHVVFGRADVQAAAFGDPAGTVVYTRSSDGGATFSEPVRVSAADHPIPFFFSNPQIVTDTKRKRLYVVYPTGTAEGRWDMYLATSTNGGKDWTHVKVNDDATCANHMTPSAALDPRTGAVHVVWTENRGGAGRVAYSRCDATGCSPNESVSDTPFATYRFVRHSVSWLGEYYSLLVDQKRRELHVVWTQPVDERGVARSRIFHSVGALR